MKEYTIAEMRYTRTDALDLRQTLIDARDAALKDGDFQSSIYLSHIIAFMAVAIDLMYKD